MPQRIVLDTLGKLCAYGYSMFGWCTACASLIAAVSAFSGCARPGTEWTKPGMTSAELRRDLVDCERQATGPGPFHFTAPGEDYEAVRDRIPRERDRCMEGRGWQATRS